MKRLIMSLLLIFITQSTFAEFMCDDANQYNAIYEINSYTCQSGEFLPANTLGCQSCPTGMSCGGGTFDFNPNKFQGLNLTDFSATTLNNICADNFYDYLTAIYVANQHTCNAGYYMPANTDGCTICPGDSYCVGGTYTFNETLTQGITACPDGYTYNTDTGKSSATQCQIHCDAGTYVDARYTQLEYLESTGTQYIDTGITANEKTEAEIDFSNYSGNEWIFFVSQGSRSTNNFGVILNEKTRFYMNCDGHVTNYSRPENFSANIKLSLTGVYIDGTKVSTANCTIPPASFNTTRSIILFGGNNTGTPSGGAKVRVNYFKLWENGELVRDFIPARRNSDNALGMYDKVTKTFFTNSGTGTFVAGAAINGLGDSSCTTCPADSYCPGGTYTFNVTTAQGITACPVGKISDAGSDDVSDCRDPAINCSAGYYLPANASVCAMCLNDSYCVGGTYNLETNVPQGIVSCASGLFAPAGMWEVAQCGRILHVGDGFVYLRATKKTTPSVNVDLDHDGVADYFGNMTTLDVPMSRDTQRKLKVRYNNTTYSIYDDSVELSLYE